MQIFSGPWTFFETAGKVARLTVKDVSDKIQAGNRYIGWTRVAVFEMNADDGLYNLVATSIQ
jgi:hypothetical protein